MATSLRTFRLGTHQSIAYTGTAGSTAAFSVGIQAARIFATTSCFVKVASAAVATSSDVPLAANTSEIVTVQEGEKVSAIQVGGAGTLHVTELT